MCLLHELCVACESMGFAKRYFSTNSHKCKAGGCCDGIILFLNTVKRGGQIVFPSSKNKTSTLGKTLPRGKKLRKRLKKLGIKKKSWEANLLNDCSRSLCIPPEKGSALLIYNFDYYKLRADARSRYGECPVLKGRKWTAKMWLWNKQ